MTSTISEDPAIDVASALEAPTTPGEESADILEEGQPLKKNQQHFSASTTLRHRRSRNGGNNKTTTTSPRIEKLKSQRMSRKKAKSFSKTTTSITSAEENLFLNMELRKAERRKSGKKKNDKGTWAETIGILCFLLLIVGLGTNDVDGDSDDVIALTAGELFGFVVWFLVCLIITSMFRETIFLRLLYWMIVYLPLLAAASVFVFADEAMETSMFLDLNQVIFIILVVAEIVVLMIFLTFYYIYPTISGSKWMREGQGRARWFWQIQQIGQFTMTYRGRNRRRRTCKYEGEIDKDTGLPQGMGRWIDDGWEGEVMTGYWDQGVPVAPFMSRTYRTGDAIRAVEIVYYQASDDEWNSSKFYASNDQPGRCGVASVECSISGSFYRHLPYAMIMKGPYTKKKDTRDDEATNNISSSTSVHNPVEECLSQLHNEDDDDNHNMTNVHINGSDPRGVQVTGHVYEPTGKFFAPEPDNINILIKKSPRLKGSYKRDFLPKQTEQSYMSQSVIVFDKPNTDVESDSSNNQEDDGKVLETIDETVSEPRPSTLDEDRTLNPAHMTSFASSGTTSSIESRRTDVTSLQVENWVPTTRKEALIFFPGFNSCMEKSFVTFGQFLSMTKLSTAIYPIIFQWPGGQILSYHSASHAANNENNIRHLQTMLKSLNAAGIRRVHLMSHSMGAQSMIAAFRNKISPDRDNSRSDVSLCFQLDPDFEEEEDDGGGDDIEEGSSGRSNNHGADCHPLLICKSITMLNPDYPLDAFIDRGFLSLRRICNMITLVGDRQDQALMISAFVNGFGSYMGYEPPEALQPKLPSTSESSNNTDHQQTSQSVNKDKTYRKCMHSHERIGKSIDSLHFLAKESGGEGNKARTEADEEEDIDVRLLFCDKAPMVLKTEVELQDDLWLDIDVIDTTGLDTNIAGLRHGGYNLNPVLINDLEELITTGRRAMKRSTVIHRDGNLFSYAHAPSYVAM